RLGEIPGRRFPRNGGSSRRSRGGLRRPVSRAPVLLLESPVPGAPGQGGRGGGALPGSRSGGPPRPLRPLPPAPPGPIRARGAGARLRSLGGDGDLPADRRAAAPEDVRGGRRRRAVAAGLARPGPAAGGGGVRAGPLSGRGRSRAARLPRSGNAGGGAGTGRV